MRGELFHRPDRGPELKNSWWVRDTLTLLAIPTHYIWRLHLSYTANSTLERGVHKFLEKLKILSTTGSLAHNSHTNKFPIKKQRLGIAAITDRGDRIRTCDLVLPKHDVVKMRLNRNLNQRQEK